MYLQEADREDIKDYIEGEDFNGYILGTVENGGTLLFIVVEGTPQNMTVVVGVYDDDFNFKVTHARGANFKFTGDWDALFCYLESEMAKYHNISYQ